MLCRLSAAALAVSMLACAGPPRPATETAAAPAIEHFFGAQEKQPQAERSDEAPVPAAEERPAPAAEAPPPAEEPALETPPVPEAPSAEPPPAAAPEAPADAIQHFFGEAAAAPEARPEEPAKDQKDGKDAKGGEKVDAFEHFFGEKPPV